MDQGKQTLNYFDTHAQGWQSRSVGMSDRYNVIAARNAAVTTTIDAMTGVGLFLDVGCGTGQLVIDVAKRGIQSKGIDFAPDMIRHCENNAKEGGVDAEFSCQSFFDLADADESYDVISAQGFIEYISPTETDKFLSRCFSLLRKGGVLVVGSRNRLFNLLSLNDYTRDELQMGTMEALAAEAIALHQSVSWERAIEALAAHEKIYPQPERHPNTGIDVDVRFQYTPCDLIKRGRAFGFRPESIFPVHFHGIPIGMKAEHPALHIELATRIGQAAAADFRLVPYCSSFVLGLIKAVQ